MSFSSLSTAAVEIPQELLEWEGCDHGIFPACQYGNLSQIERLQMCDPQCVHYLDQQGRTPLMIAAEHGHLDICAWLLEECAIPSDIEFRKRIDSNNRTTNDAATPLIVACRNGHVNVVNYLLDKGANVNAEKLRNVTPLFIAAQCGHPDVCRTLISHGAIVDSFTSYHASPLYITAQNGHVSCAYILLDNGADPNALREHNVSPLYVAAQNGHFEMVRVLHKGGGDPMLFRERGIGPLYAAAQGGYVKVVEYLVNNTTLDPNRDIPGTVCRPLTISCHYGHYDVVKVLLEQAKVDINYAENPRFSPFALSLANTNFRIPLLLSAHGAQWEVRSARQMDDLLRGAELQMPRSNIASFLDMTRNWTRFQFAVLARQPKLITEMLCSGADPYGHEPSLLTLANLSNPSFPQVCPDTTAIINQAIMPWSPKTDHLYGPQFRGFVHTILQITSQIPYTSPAFLPPELWLHVCKFFRRCDFDRVAKVDYNPDSINDST